MRAFGAQTAANGYPDADLAPAAMSRGLVAALVALALLGVGLAGFAGYAGLPRTSVAAAERPAGGAGDARTDVAAAPATAPVGAGEGTERPGPASADLQTNRGRTSTGEPGTSPELRWPLWEFQLRQPIPPRDPPLTPPPWRLVGSATTGPTKQLIILRQGKTAPEFYVKGDSLPGGYVVGEITDEDVTLIHGKRALLLSFIGIR